jgi:hypothetical protein
VSGSRSDNDPIKWAGGPLRQIAHATMDLSLSLETQSNLSKDHQEAVSAFAAKRRPNFAGK